MIVVGMGKRIVAAALTGLAAVAIYRRLLRPWHERWGATDDEARDPLPGDGLVAEPAQQVTRAIGVDARPEDVWPWIVQIGADRGGFYSYDWLENLFGLGIHSADSIVAEWQTRDVGDLVTADHKASGGWYVMDVRPDDALVLMLADVPVGRPMYRTERKHWEFVWIFAVRDGPDGTTRVLIRERTGFDNRFVKWLLAPVGPVSFVMTRKTLLGIKERAERVRRSGEREPTVSRR